MVYILSALLLSSCGSKNTVIHQWRGTERNGIYSGEGLLEVWPQEGPSELRVIAGLGNGYGSPVFSGEHFFITGEVDSMANLFCFDPEGSKHWQTLLGPEWVTSFPGSRSAPTIAGDRIYVGTGMGDLFCVDRADGNVIWTRYFEKDFQGVYPLHGHSEAAAVYRDLVFWTPGGPGHNVVALDRFTGEIIWSSPAMGERSAYHHPRVIELPSRAILVTFSAYHLMGLDAMTGELLWTHEQDNLPPEDRKIGYGDTHANTVLFDQGAIYYAAGDGNGGVKLELSEDGSSIRELWRNPGFDSFMGGIVKIGETLYGGGSSRRFLKSIHAGSGEIIDSLDINTGAVIAAGNRLYYYNWKGEMHLVAFDEGRLGPVSSFRITRGTREHFSHPVIHQGILYQRHGNVLIAYKIHN